MGDESHHPLCKHTRILLHHWCNFIIFGVNPPEFDPANLRQARSHTNYYSTNVDSAICIFLKQIQKQYRYMMSWMVISHFQPHNYIF